MEKKLFIVIILVSVVFTVMVCSTPLATAMGKRPTATDKEKSEEFVLPEIEIISKPEANKELLSRDRKKPGARVQVSPQEVLPAVGKDAETLKKSYRLTDIQRALTNAGFSPGPIDGKMGPKTKKAILEFQKKNDLTVDGIVGAKTWERLKPYLN